MNKPSVTLKQFLFDVVRPYKWYVDLVPRNFRCDAKVKINFITNLVLLNQIEGDSRLVADFVTPKTYFKKPYWFNM